MAIIIDDLAAVTLMMTGHSVGTSFSKIPDTEINSIQKGEVEKYQIIKIGEFKINIDKLPPIYDKYLNKNATNFKRLLATPFYLYSSLNSATLGCYRKVEDTSVTPNTRTYTKLNGAKILAMVPAVAYACAMQTINDSLKEGVTVADVIAAVGMKRLLKDIIGLLPNTVTQNELRPCFALKKATSALPYDTDFSHDGNLFIVEYNNHIYGNINNTGLDVTRNSHYYDVRQAVSEYFDDEELTGAGSGSLSNYYFVFANPLPLID